MKKLFVVGIAALSLTLTACGGQSFNTPAQQPVYPQGPAGSDTDWDLDHSSIYNNQTYCSNGVYNPLPNGQYSCTRNGVVSPPTVRPATPVIPPKIIQQAPKPAAPAPKPAAPAPKAPAPAPAPKAPAPAPKTGK